MAQITDAYLVKAYPVLVPFDRVRLPVLNSAVNDVFNSMEVVVRATNDYKSLIVCFSTPIVPGRSGFVWQEPKHSKAVSQLVGMQTAFGGECDTSIELHRDSLCVVLGHEDCVVNGFGYDIIPVPGCDHEIARVHRKFTSIYQGRAEALTNFASAYLAQD